MNYKKIKFKGGLEVHQQLDTKRKLFCNCPPILRNDEPDIIIKRKLHPVSGEGGTIDKAAKFESLKGKEFIYQGYSDSNCLVEYDESPPRLIDLEALQIALHISLLLNCKIQPITQIMRKTVIDGSNTSGFQRTVMIARDGFIETSKGKVGIWYVYLEEDAARQVERSESQSCKTDKLISSREGGGAGTKRGEEKSGLTNGNKVYRLDRLGIPLVEIVTAPDIKDAEHAKEVALHIGNILRSCKVKRGIGTIRQDINISIKGHPRAEIKGFQNPKIFVKVVEKEIQRQLNDLEKNKKDLQPEVRGANPDSTTKFLRPLPGEARMYPETDLPLLKISRDIINQAKKTLPKSREQTEIELTKQGLNKDMIKLLFKQNKVKEFKELLKIINKPQLIAKIILMWPKEIAKREKITLEKVEEKLEDNYSDILNAINKKKIKESDVKDIMLKLVKGVNFKQAIKKEKADTKDIEEQIRKLIKDKPGLSEKAYMGLVMKEFKGKVDGKEVMGIIRRFLG